MDRRLGMAFALRSLLVLVVLAGLLACGEESADDEPQGDSESDSLGDPLADSVEEFVQARSVEARFEMSVRYPGGSADITGETGLTENTAAYLSASTTFEVLDQEGSSEFIYIGQDLYINLPDEGWYVLSPWNQGVRPDELPEFSIEDPIVDYPQLVSDLRDVECLKDEDGVVRCEGEADVADLPGLVGEGASGDARVDIEIDSETLLPQLVKISATPGDDVIVVSVEFFNFGAEILLPERPRDAKPWRDLAFPEAPCIGDAFEGCLAEQTAIEPSGDLECAGDGRRICLVPLGQVPPDMVAHLSDYYRTEYGLEVNVLPPATVPSEMADPLRQQVDAAQLIDYVGELFPVAYADSDAVLIGLTPTDLYNSDSHFRYVFGIKGNVSDPKAVISSLRMSPEFYGERADSELLYSRTRKLLTKYIGLLYYGLSENDDPTSPMYGRILGPDDLDRMTEPLSVE